MEEHVRQILYKVYSPPSENSNPQDAFDEINSLWENPEFYQALFVIFKTQANDSNIRILSTIVLKRLIHFRWDNFSPEFQQVFLQNIPELIIGVITQEPQFLSYLSDLIEQLISSTFEQYFSNYWVQFVTSLLPASREHFLTGLLIIKCLLQVIIQNTAINNQFQKDEDFKETLRSFFYSMFETITSFYVSSDINCFLRTLCLKIATYMVNLFPEICIESNFLPWYQTVAWCIAPELAGTFEPSFELPSGFSFRLPLNNETSAFFIELLTLFYNCQRVFSLQGKTDEVPFSTQLFLLVAGILYGQDWADNAEQDLFIPFIKFFEKLVCKASDSWTAFYLPNFPQIIQQIFFPLFEIPSNSLEIIAEEPFKFIEDYHIETSIGNDDNHILPAQAALETLDNIARENPETHETLFSVAVAALEDFGSTNNVLLLYSLFHFCSSYWGTLVSSKNEAVQQFMDHLLELLTQSFAQEESPPKWLFQSAVLLLLSQANPRPPKNSHQFNIINPAYVEASIRLLDSSSPLIHYFASFTLYSLLFFYTDSDLENDEDEELSKAARESLFDVCAPYSLPVINSIIEYCQKYGKTEFAKTISILIKNDKVLQNMMAYLPNFVDSIFTAAASLVQTEIVNGMPVISNVQDIYDVFLGLLNLVDHLVNYQAAHDQICVIIFTKCLESFGLFCTCPVIYELLSIILGKAPSYNEELYNQIFQPIFEQITNPVFINSVDSNDFDSIINESSSIFHNMMVRSPQFMATMNEQKGNCLFAFGELMMQYGKDYTPMTIYFSGLMAIIEPEKFPHELFEAVYEKLSPEDISIPVDIVGNDYRAAYDMFYYMIRYDPEYFINQEPEILEGVLEIANDIDLGCIISLIGTFIPPERRNEALHTIVAKAQSPEMLIQDYYSESIDDDNYENETNYVNQSRHYVSSFPAELALKTFLDYLRTLIKEEPDIIQIFQDCMPNLTCLLK